MILQPNSLSRHSGPPAPTWLRRAVSDAQGLVSKDVADVALVGGASIGALDAVVRRQERWAGAWCQRLALAAGAVTARQAGRVEDEAARRAIADAQSLAGKGIEDIALGLLPFVV